MTPSQYLNQYHNLTYTLDDDSERVAHLERYQSGALGLPWAARVPVLEGIARELSSQPGARRISAWHLPPNFVIDVQALTSMGVMRVFMGKGSPDEIRDVIRLAHRFGIITNPARLTPPPNRTVAQYAADFLGLDCNAFVGNYFGMNPETEIPTYARTRRRRSVQEVRSGDVVISNVLLGNRYRPEHIALTEGFDGDVLTIVEWGTAGQRHHTARRRVRTQTDEEGRLYYDYVSQEPAHKDMNGRKYFHAPPRTPFSRGYVLLPPDV